MMRRFYYTLQATRKNLSDPTWLDSFASQHLSATHSLYQNTPLFYSSNRGIILERYVRAKYDGIVGQTKQAGVLSGTMNVSEYDFLSITGDRVEVKSSSVLWDKYSDRCKLYFRGIKHGKYDTLLLLGYFPDEVVLWEWNGKEGLSKSRKNMKFLGDNIISWTKKNQSWQSLKSKPFGSIVYKASCNELACWETLTESEKIYINSKSPFMRLSGSMRGKASNILGFLTYQCFIEDSFLTKGEYSDFQTVSGKKVKVKSSFMHAYSPGQSSSLTRFLFSNIKENECDELMLMFHFVDRLEFWIWDKNTTLSSMGIRSKFLGNCLYFYCDSKNRICKCPGTLIHSIYYE